ncbi:IucA/IucC family protein [Microtetraspora sp. NBRC 16547]|uniref:IucA/IucC family protein n=1 Tax=Microtetraspora sp. NBRC 16547 TaxID=3030993 RepID=UPI002553C8C9|nr:IucA/IucC family protein [Microtetraspora sp. NBRC 16547]
MNAVSTAESRPRGRPRSRPPTDEDRRAVAETVTLGALLRCCVREVAGPRGQVWPAGPYLLLRVAGTLLRARVHGGIALRFDGPAEWLAGGAWQPLTSEMLVKLVEQELPGGNEEFAAQVASSREAITALLRARERTGAPEDPWLASEQALVAGHPFHPSPKAREGSGWVRYAPEAHARFPLRLLGVRADLVAGRGETGALDLFGSAPPGYVPLPAHPWQLDLLADELRGPLADGRLVDLGDGSRPVVPTSSVRTVYDPETGMCLKFSLDVRITNCVRKNAWYELIGAVELSERLGPVFARLAADFPGTRWLPEPGYRSADLGVRLLEGLGVILRPGPWTVCGPGVTPVLAGALAGPLPGPIAVPAAVPAAGSAAGSAGRAARAPGPYGAADPLDWWRSYVEKVAPPVLDAYFTHGVVLEPHLQNVLLGVDHHGLPREVIFRDMEGTKLLRDRHDVSDLPSAVATALTYDAERGWNRIVYCLLVNHLAEIAATVAEHAGQDLSPELWAIARDVLAAYAAGHGSPPLLAELLAGAPLPAKANLGVRWARGADRSAGYVPIANPLA